MIDDHVDDLWNGVDQAIDTMSAGAFPGDGNVASVAVVQLMRDTFAKIAPMNIVETFKVHEDEQPRAIVQALSDKFGLPHYRRHCPGSNCLSTLQ